MPKATLTLAFTIVLFVSIAAGQQFYVELDLDNTVGNGPDTVYVNPGDSLEVDIWWLSSAPNSEVRWVVETICESDGILQFVANNYAECGQGWIYRPPEFPGLGCIALESEYPPLRPKKEKLATNCSTPLLHSVVTYVVAEENALANLTVDEADSYVFSWTHFQTIYAENSIGAVVRSGETTANTETAWGTIKQLFR